MPEVGSVIDEDAKDIKHIVIDHAPQSIIKMTDGSTHFEPTDSLSVLETRMSEEWDKTYVKRTTWNKKSKTVYTGSDGVTTKDVDISKVITEVII